MNGITKEISDIINVGVTDRKVDLFEGQYRVPDGMRYNSYVIIDEKIAVTDTVAEGFGDEWLANIEEALGARKPDYLIIHHVEPDHSANIAAFLGKYPEVEVVAGKRAFPMIDAFYGAELCKKRIAVGEGDTLCLGRHTLSFIPAPMVHWPEVTVSFDTAEGVLFSADAFGRFGSGDMENTDDDEARRYYIGIVGKYGVQVQSLLAEAKKLAVKAICPLHGPVLTDSIAHAVSLYDKWSSYTPEETGVLIAYTSVYGNTRRAAELLADKLSEKGEKVVLRDLSRTDIPAAVADAFRFDRLVLASTTYNGTVIPAMRQFIDWLTERGFRGRTVGIIENGSWAPTAAKAMHTMLEKSAELIFTERNVRIRSALTCENIGELNELADELIKLKN